MKKTALVFSSVFLPLLSASGESSLERGQRISQTSCVACHGPKGVSFNPDWPSLYGQGENYLKKQLEAYRSGDRQDDLMTPFALTLTDQDIADVSAYFAQFSLQNCQTKKSSHE